MIIDTFHVQIDTIQKPSQCNIKFSDLVPKNEVIQQILCRYFEKKNIKLDKVSEKREFSKFDVDQSGISFYEKKINELKHSSIVSSFIKTHDFETNVNDNEKKGEVTVKLLMPFRERGHIAEFKESLNVQVHTWLEKETTKDELINCHIASLKLLFHWNPCLVPYGLRYTLSTLKRQDWPAVSTLLTIPYMDWSILHKELTCTEHLLLDGNYVIVLQTNQFYSFFKVTALKIWVF